MSHQGNIQFLVLISASADQVSEGERIFQSHAQWMEKTHHREGDKALLRYNVSQAPEVRDPMDPDSSPTGRTLFILSEVYETPAGLQDHWQQGQESWEDFDAFKSWLGIVDFSMVNGAEIVHSLW